MKKKLMLLITGLHYGGMERVAFIARELLEAEYDVKVVTLYTKDADYIPDFEYLDLKCPPLKTKQGKIFNTFKRILAVKRTKNKIKPDLVMSFGTAANFCNVVTKSEEQVIVGIRSYDWLYQYFINFSIDRWTYQKADKVVSVSKVISNDAIKKFNLTSSKCEVLYNPYDVTFIKELANESVTEFVIDPSTKIILSVGRLVDQKGFNHLLKSFSIVLESQPDTVLIIIGKGNREQDLKRMIKELGIEKNVLMLGGHSNPYKFMRIADVYALSSLTEGFPNAMVEAMAMGLPIVAADCKSGPREILSDQNINKKAITLEMGEHGVIVPSMSGSLNYEFGIIEECERLLAEGLIKVLSDSSLRDVYKINSRLRANEFSYQKFHDELKKILNKEQ